VSTLTYGLILAWKESFFRSNWRPLVFGSSFFTGLLGGFPLALFCLFSMISEFTADRPHIRGMAFALMSGVIAVATVVGTQLSGVLMARDPFYVFAAGFCAIAALIAFQLLLLEETVPFEVKARPIDWRRTNILSAIMFLVPSTHTRRMHAEDRLHSYEALCQKILDSEVGSDVAVSQGLIDDTAEGLGALSPLAGPVDDSYGLLSADSTTKPAAPDSSAGARRPGGTLDGDFLLGDDAPLRSVRAKANKRGHELDSAASEGLLAGADADPGSLAALSAPKPEAEDVSAYAETNAARKLVSAGLSLPPVPPERGNALIVFALMIFLLAAAMAGEEGNFLPYLKQTYHVTDTEMANVSTIDSCARLVGSFLFVRLTHMFVSTRWGELRLTQLLLFLVGSIFVCIHFCNELWQTALLKATSSAFTVVPGGFVRGLISTEVGMLLQGKVLAAIAAIEVITAITGSLTFTSIFAASNESMPTLIFIVGGSMTCIASVMPFFINDSRIAFNARRPGPPRKQKPVDGADADTNTEPGVNIEVGSDDAFADALGPNSSPDSMPSPHLRSGSARIN
jgi:hypothetical protein